MIATLEGIPLDAQKIQWGLTSGLRPYFFDFVVNAKYLDKVNSLLSLGKSVSLKLENKGGTYNKNTVHSLTFDNLEVLQVKPAMYGRIIIQVADGRYRLKGRKINLNFNKSLYKNDNTLLDEPYSGDPRKLREQFTLGKEGRYALWTVKENGDPYTVAEILYKVLTEQGWSVTEDASVENSDYVLENIEVENGDVYDTIQYLLGLCRLNIYLNKEGTSLVLYGIDYGDSQFLTINNLKDLNHVIPSQPYKTDLKYVRPKQIIISYRKLRETRFVLVDTPAAEKLGVERLIVPPLKDVYTQQDINAWKIIGCIAVVRVPRSIGKWNKGEWVPIKQYLEVLKISDSQFRRTYVSKVYIGEYGRKLRTGAITVDGVTKPTTVAAGHVLANVLLAPLYAAYRTTYQIDPYFVDKIRQWMPKQVSIITTYGKQSAPSSVNTDYSFLTLGKDPGTKTNKDNIHDVCSSHLINRDDPTRTGGSPFGISVLDKELGIFKVVTPSDYQGAYFMLTPFAFTGNMSLPGMGSLITLVNKLTIAEVHHMDTVMSVEFYTDPKLDNSFKGNRYYGRVYHLQDGKGPVVEALCNLEYARYSITGSLSKPENAGVLDRLARAEAAKMLNIFKDRVSGYVEASGFVNTTPNGHLSNIIYKVAENGQLSTTLDFRVIPPNPSVAQNLPQKDISLIYGQITRT